MMRYLALLVFVAVTSVPEYCDGLKYGEPGVCKALPKTIRKTYWVRCYDNPNRRCRKYKNVRIPTSHSALICCPSWEYVKQEDRCKAVCMQGCVDGRCVSPDKCVCDPPLTLRNNNTCTAPTCDPPCLGGQCVADDTCLCPEHLALVNATHCALPCAPGHNRDPITLNCLPTCDWPCINGTCTGPNSCTCNDGFKLSDDYYKCIPDCNPPCENGHCIGINICECLPGYESDTAGKCKPVCHNCEHGTCLAPGNCQCSSGYSFKNGTCEPKCEEPCVNGFCSEPNTCTCYVGYRKNAFNPNQCFPVCTPECQNSDCLTPGKCSCHDGYEHTNTSHICVAKCDNCHHGECIRPNECKCDEGYTIMNGSCSPVCEPSCINGVCSEPNVCECNIGYTLWSGSEHECEPVCSPNCVNATCKSPNSCLCLPGFKSTNISSECEPKCDSCEDGVCIAPNVCKCNDGYLLGSGRCVPACEEGCLNGYCTSPNNCTCKEGYEQDEDKNNVCYKICNDSRRCLDEACCEDLVECNTCQGSCVDGVCTCAETHAPCYRSGTDSELTKTSLAGLEITWLSLAGVSFLLLIILILVIIHLYRRKHTYKAKSSDETVYGSVIYTTPDTLLTRRMREYDEQDVDRKNESLNQLLDDEIRNGVPLV